MDLADFATTDLPPSSSSTTTTAAAATHTSQGEHYVTSVAEDHETTCWGCGLHLLLSPYAPIFKCGWCGAITNQNARKSDNYFWWRRLRDRCFVGVLLVFMLFCYMVCNLKDNCGGIWAIYPVVFSLSYFCGVFHCCMAVSLSVTTISTFSLAAFRSAGGPPIILWGSYPVVGKGDLENYTFSIYCSKPKSPRAHHCRSCRMCVVDMDHHCPFIGNCVGAANHPSFVLFLISIVVSTIYVSIVSAYASLHIWPTVSYRPLDLYNAFVDNGMILITAKEFILAVLRSTMFLSMRGLVLAYLFISSVSVEIGLGVLLWQQLCYIYEGKTYLSHLSSLENDGVGEKDCQNLIRFFDCPYPALRYLPTFWNDRKRHKK